MPLMHLTEIFVSRSPKDQFLQDPKFIVDEKDAPDASNDKFFVLKTSLLDESVVELAWYCIYIHIWGLCFVAYAREKQTHLNAPWVLSLLFREVNGLHTRGWEMEQSLWRSYFFSFERVCLIIHPLCMYMSIYRNFLFTGTYICIPLLVFLATIRGIHAFSFAYEKCTSSP